MKKIKWINILLIIFVLWLGISIFFYNQHIVTVWNYKVNKQIEIGDTKVIINEIILQNYELDDNNFRFISSNILFNKLLPVLPYKMRVPIYKLYTFYNSPYKFNNEFLNIKLKVKLVSEKFKSKDNIDDIEDSIDNIDIEIIDNIGIHYYSGRRYTIDETSNTIPIEIRDSCFPIKKINKPLIINLTDKKNKINWQFKVQPKFIKNKYGFFDQKTYEDY